MTVGLGMPDAPAPLLDQVRRLDGVHAVERDGARITVRGHRRIIAYVGAALVQWEPVPADLSVHVPTLEDALLGLLEERPATGTPSLAEMNLVGGQR